MNSKLNSTEYNSAIKIYYQDVLSTELAERIIEYVWLNPGLHQNEEDFKLIQDTKAKVYKVKFDDHVYYLKSYAYRNTSKVIKTIFRPVDAIRCFQTGIKLKNANIAAVKPVLALTMRKNAFLVDSIFVTQEVPGVDLYTYLSNNNQYDTELREKIVKKVAVIWSKLVNHNFLHLDPWLGNFMVYPEHGDIQLELIDIDNIYSLPFLPQEMLLIRNLARLRGKQLNSFSATQAEIDLFLEEFSTSYNLLKGSGLRFALSLLIRKSQ